MAISSEARSRITADFPHLAHLLDNAELSSFWEDIFNRATTTGISDGEFTQLFWDTSWFQSRSGAARQWDTLVTQDPREAEARRSASTFKLRNMATEWGVTIPENRLASMVEQQLRWGLSDEEMQASLATMADASTVRPGTLRATQDAIAALSSSYFQDHRDQEFFQFATDVMSGKTSLEAIEVMFRDQAKMDYAHLADQLDSFNMDQLTGGLRNRLSVLLDRDPGTIDMTSDRYSHLLSMVDEKGVTRTATNSEVGEWARTQREYLGSSSGRKQGTKLIKGLAGALGKAAF